MLRGHGRSHAALLLVQIEYRPVCIERRQRCDKRVRVIFPRQWQSDTRNDMRSSVSAYRGTGGGVVRPQPVEQEEQPHQSDQHECVESQRRYHAYAPSTRSWRRPLYRVCTLCELSASLRDIYGPARAVKRLSSETIRFRTDAVIYPTSW